MLTRVETNHSGVTWAQKAKPFKLINLYWSSHFNSSMLVVLVEVVLVMTKQTYPHTHTPLAKAAKRKAYSYRLVQRCSFYGVAAAGVKAAAAAVKKV